MSYWYLNKEGFPKVSLRERINPGNTHQYQKEISEIQQIEKDINKFYPLCKILKQGILSNLIPNRFSDDLLNNTNSKFNIVLKGRQVGVTCTLSVIALYNALFLNKNVVIASRNKNVSIDILNRILTMYINIEEHLKYGVCGLTKTKVTFNNGKSIRVISSLKNYNSSIDLLIIDEYDFISPMMKKYFITSVCPVIASRINDKVIITSSIRRGLINKEEYSVEDLITNNDYEIFNFNVLTINCFDLIVKQYNRNKKISEILDEKS